MFSDGFPLSATCFSCASISVDSLLCVLCLDCKIYRVLFFILPLLSVWPFSSSSSEKHCTLLSLSMFSVSLVCTSPISYAGVSIRRVTRASKLVSVRASPFVSSSTFGNEEVIKITTFLSCSYGISLPLTRVSHISQKWRWSLQGYLGTHCVRPRVPAGVS